MMLNIFETLRERKREKNYNQKIKIKITTDLMFQTLLVLSNLINNTGSHQEQTYTGHIPVLHNRCQRFQEN